MKKVESVEITTEVGNMVAAIDSGSVYVVSPTTGKKLKVESVMIKGFTKGVVTFSADGKKANLSADGEISILSALVNSAKKGAELYVADSTEWSNIRSDESFGAPFDIARTKDGEEVLGAYRYAN